MEIAWRSLIKNRAFSFINIAGLSIGISTCFIIMVYVQNELSYDRFNKNADRIVRIVFKADINGGKIFEANVMPPVAQAMKNDYPEMEDATRLQVAGAPKITYKDKSFKVKIADIKGLLATMKLKWNQFNTDEPFSFTFMDDLYNKTYAAEQNTGTILNIFALLTIFVACLGLFGLATYTAEQRTKEIGIRKVLGASVTSVTKMLSKDFLKLVFIFCVIAFPLSRWVMNKWLQSFAYRINISLLDICSGRNYSNFNSIDNG